MNYYNHLTNAFQSPGASSSYPSLAMQIDDGITPLPYFPNQINGSQRSIIPSGYSNQSMPLIIAPDEEYARAYLVAPNNTVYMIDLNHDRFYVKTLDGAGKVTFKVYGDISTPEPSVEEWKITKEEYEFLLARCDELSARIEQISTPEPVKRTSKKAAGGADDE